MKILTRHGTTQAFAMLQKSRSSGFSKAPRASTRSMIFGLPIGWRSASGLQGLDASFFLRRLTSRALKMISAAFLSVSSLFFLRDVRQHAGIRPECRMYFASS